jgi:hypothetical protein
MPRLPFFPAFDKKIQIMAGGIIFPECPSIGTVWGLV